MRIRTFKTAPLERTVVDFRIRNIYTSSTGNTARTYFGFNEKYIEPDGTILTTLQYTASGNYIPEFSSAKYGYLLQNYSPTYTGLWLLEIWTNNATYVYLECTCNDRIYTMNGDSLYMSGGYLEGNLYAIFIDFVNDGSAFGMWNSYGKVYSPERDPISGIYIKLPLYGYKFEVDTLDLYI